MIRAAIASLATAALFAALPALAQQKTQSPPANINPQAQLPGHLPSQQDSDFAHRAALAGMEEVALGKVAMQRTDNAAVADFARVMIEQHGHANDRLAHIAEEDGIALPHELDQQQKSARAHFAGLSGSAFDRDYIHNQIQDHQHAISLLQSEARSAQATNLKRFATDLLPIFQQHLRMAQEVDARLSPQATGGAENTGGSSMPPRQQTPSGASSTSQGTAGQQQK